MDWENPLRSLSATVDADVLKALSTADDAVTGSELARLAGRSYAQVYAVVGRMVDDGLVRMARYGRTKTYRLNRDHVLAHAVLRVLAAPVRVEGEIRRLGLAWNPQPVSIAFVGPTARRQTAPDEAIDLLIVRPEAVSERDAGWSAQVDDLSLAARALSGNQVHVIEVSESRLRAGTSVGRLANGQLARESRTIVGEDLRHFVAIRGTA